MHLDGFNAKLKLAFEYHGRQHYEYDSYFYKCEEEFEKRKRDDKLKKKLCKKNGITLIEIGWERKDGKLYKINYDDMEEYIRKKCEETGIITPVSIMKFNWRDFNIYKNIDKLTKVKEIIKAKGGTLLSTAYIAAHSPILVVCKNDHLFTKRPSALKSGSWCPACAGQARYTINDIIEFGNNVYPSGAKCLNPELYFNNENAHTPLSWQCNKCNYIWYTSINSLKGCPNCRNVLKKTIKDIEDLGKLAPPKGAICLNPEQYKNVDNHLLWKCNKCNNIWSSSYGYLRNRINNGIGCPFCWKQKKLKNKKESSIYQEVANFLKGHPLATNQELYNQFVNAKKDTLRRYKNIILRRNS